MFRDGEMLTEVIAHKKDGLLSQAIRLPNNDIFTKPIFLL